MKTIACGVLLATLALTACEREPAPELPALPVLAWDAFLPAVRQQMSAALAAIDADPRNADANGRLGMILHAYHQHAEAAACYERARRLDPGAFHWAYYQADVLEKLGRADDARSALDAALALDPDDPRARVRLADLELAAGQLDSARRRYEGVIRDHPQRADARYGLAQLALRTDEPAEAIRELRLVLAAAGDSAPVHYALADAYRRLGDREAVSRHLAAHARFERIPFVPDDLALREIGDLVQSDRPHVRAAMALADAGRTEEAIVEYRRALERNPANALAHASLMGLYGRLGRLQEAEHHYREAVALNPSLSMPHFNMGIIQLRAKDYAAAAEALERALRIEGHDAQGRMYLGFALERLGRREEAMAQYQEVLVSDPAYHKARHALSRLLVADNRLSEAAEQLERTLTPVDDATPLILRDIATLRRKTGEIERARTSLQRARELAVQRGNMQLAAELARDLEGLPRTGAREPDAAQRVPGT